MKSGMTPPQQLLTTSNLPTELSNLYREVCLHDESAYTFLCQWHETVHQIDDIVDEDVDSKEKTIECFIRLHELYANPFYRKHEDKLSMVVTLVTNMYADSVEWEKSDTEWKRKWGDFLRFAGNEMAYAVAYIVGGWTHLRFISRMFRVLSYTDHHTENHEQI